MPHGLVTGNTISSPTVFVGFGTDWRTVMEAYGDANAGNRSKIAVETAAAVRLEQLVCLRQRRQFLQRNRRFKFHQK